MNKYIFSMIAGIAVIGFLLIRCDTNPASGTEIENERFVARIVNPDGTAAVNATVTVLPVTFIPDKEGMAKTKLTTLRKKTDSKGTFNICDLEEGCYNFYVQSENGNLAAFADSIYLSSNGIDNGEIALDSTGTLLGNIRVQPNHDPRIVEVQILGTHLYTNVDENGFFSFPRIALGEYRLRCVANRDGYVTTYRTVKVERTMVDTTLSNLITILYTGIPVVEGLHAAYDSLTNHITVKWNKSSYSDLDAYVIFRDRKGTVQPSSVPLAATTDTFFVDPMTLGTSELYLSEPYHYRVAIRDNSMALGPTYGYCLISLPEFRLFVEIYSFSDTVRTGDTITFGFKAQSNPSPLQKISWFGNNVLMKEDSSLNGQNTIDTTERFVVPRDTIHSTFELWCTVVNRSGMSASDSLRIQLLDTARYLPDNPYDTLYIRSDSTHTILQNDTLYIFQDTTLSGNQRDTVFLRSDSTDTIFGNDTLYIIQDTTLIGLRFDEERGSYVNRRVDMLHQAGIRFFEERYPWRKI